ncbi:MAG: hypothetical protein KJ007_10230 [Burkholderiales bacterium]|nr:hypothetical protein [Burkholderiales bacterium]
MAFAWTKFQDFYLRLGFLKVLAVSLDPSRRSALNQAIERRMAVPLFQPADVYPELWRRLETLIKEEELETKPTKTVTVAEALLAVGRSPSALFAITPETIYKIIDWGHDVGFLGRGNQISERALLLRALMPERAFNAFLDKQVDAWDPFVLTVPERILFLYHLSEIDATTTGLIDALALVPEGTELEASDASRLLCKAMFEHLREAEPGVAPRESPVFRTARELACVIARELKMVEFEAECGELASQTKIGKPMKRLGLARPADKKQQRQTTKSADHQTIPRFEQLTDLGFLTKAARNEDEGGYRARKRWRYLPTTACKRWSAKRQECSKEARFLWSGFAKTVVAAFDLGTPRSNDGAEVVNYLWRAYEAVHRPMGHTPFDSVALYGMVLAASDGVAIEISEFHRLMLDIKQRQLCPDKAFFASGNEIDKMFILLKPGFPDALILALNKK